MTKKRVLRWILVLLWMVIIFKFSSDIASESSQKSGYVKGMIEGFIGCIGGDSGDVTEHVVRKIGHLTEYAILGILFIRAFTQESKIRFRDKTEKERVNIDIIVTIIFVMLYAVSDEVHQLFVEGRSGQVSDVFIDTAGGIIGIFILFILKKLKKMSLKLN